MDFFASCTDFVALARAFLELQEAVLAFSSAFLSCLNLARAYFLVAKRFFSRAFLA
jgi:hypothetical protein